MASVRAPARRLLAAPAVALVACAALFLPARPGSADFQDRQQRKQILQGVVILLAADMKGETLVPVGSGSGSVVTADGAVLTNYHVIFDTESGRPRDAVVIGLLKEFDAEPEPACVAIPRRAKVVRDKDLALLKCEYDLQGRPYQPRGWPAMPLGASRDLIPGDSVFVLGYPGAGGTTIHVTAGQVSGFQGELGGPGRDWIKTDAAITHGNSGGAAVGQSGQLIGVPSAFRLAAEGQGRSTAKVGLIRPIEAAQELLDDAQAGWTPEDEALVPPAGGFGKGPEPARPAPKGVWITSRVVDNDNGAAVANAVVLVLKPGVRVAQLTRDNIGEKFLTKAVSGADGRFVTEAPVPRGHAFSVVVAHEDYEFLAADDVLRTDADSPDRFDPWGKIRLERR